MPHHPYKAAAAVVQPQDHCLSLGWRVDMVGQQVWGRCDLCGWGSGVTQDVTRPVNPTRALGASLPLSLLGCSHIHFLLHGSPGEPRDRGDCGAWGGAGQYSPTCHAWNFYLPPELPVFLPEPQLPTRSGSQILSSSCSQVCPHLGDSRSSRCPASCF